MSLRNVRREPAMSSEAPAGNSRSSHSRNSLVSARSSSERQNAWLLSQWHLDLLTKRGLGTGVDLFDTGLMLSQFARPVSSGHGDLDAAPARPLNLFLKMIR